MKKILAGLLLLMCFACYLPLDGMFQRISKLSPKLLSKKSISRRAYKISNAQAALLLRPKTALMRLHALLRQLYHQKIGPLLYFKKQQQTTEVKPVRIVKPRFDVEKLHLTIDLSKPIQEIRNKLKLYSENYKDKKSWGKFSVTFKMNQHEMTWEAEHSPKSRMVSNVFEFLAEFTARNQTKLQNYAKKLTPSGPLDVPLYLEFQFCFEGQGQSLF